MKVIELVVNLSVKEPENVNNLATATSQTEELFAAIRQLVKQQDSEIDSAIVKIENLIAATPGSLRTSSPDPKERKASPLFALLYQMKNSILIEDSRKKLEQLAIRLIENDQIDFQQQTEGGNTVLHYVFYNGPYAAAESTIAKLIKNGDIQACIQPQNIANETPFDNILNSAYLNSDQKWQLMDLLQPHLSFLQLMNLAEKMTQLVSENCPYVAVCLWESNQKNYIQLKQLIAKMQTCISSINSANTNFQSEDFKCLEALSDKIKQLNASNLKQTSDWIRQQQLQLTQSKTTQASNFFPPSSANTIQKFLQESTKLLENISKINTDFAQAMARYARMSAPCF